jgi:hypothetical protein
VLPGSALIVHALADEITATLRSYVREDLRMAQSPTSGMGTGVSILLMKEAVEVVVG